MNMLKTGGCGEHPKSPSYSVKVRGLRYLWGSAGLTSNVTFDNAFILHIANDLSGKPLKVGTQLATGTQSEFGIISPGECVSLPVNNLSGIYADCDSESLVHCLLMY